MKPGDLVLVIDPGAPRSRPCPLWRELLYERKTGVHCLGVAVEGEHLIILEAAPDPQRSIKVLHPEVGPCFIHKRTIKVVNETR